MKNRALNVSAILALAALVAIPMAFAADLAVNIPFDFVVSNKTLPAGAYTVECNRDGAPTVVLRSVDSKAALIAVTAAVGGGKIVREGKLIFSRYGDTYFLAQVWRPGHRTGNALPQSRMEREMASRTGAGATTELALGPKTK